VSFHFDSFFFAFFVLIVINRTMERIASQTRLDGQLLHGAPALEWPQVSNIPKEGCLMYSSVIFSILIPTNLKTQMKILLE
jgi:hypothetical protein